MIEKDDILISIAISLLILVIIWVIGSVLLRKLGIICCTKKENKEDKETKKMIKMDDEALIDYSWENVQPELKKPTSENRYAANNRYEKPNMEKAFLNSILNSAVDSADEMSLIYDIYGETEADQQRKTEVVTTRFAKYLNNVPGDEPVILVSLHYTKGNLILAIIKVANLKPLFNNKAPDPYVRVDVWIGKKINLKKKTFVMKQEMNPVYNQKMEFLVSPKDLPNVKIVLTIATCVLSPQHDAVPLHKLEFGEQSSGSCLEHWKTAITTNKPIAKWHLFLH